MGFTLPEPLFINFNGRFIMKNVLFLFLFISLTTNLITAAALSDSTQHGYIGVEQCSMCHKSDAQGKQLDIWKNSAHSKAYLTLKTEKADSIVKAMNLGTSAITTEKCLKCHVTGNNVDKKFIGAKFKMEDGVQCETCHGPGSDYKSPTVMKNREEAVKKGLVIHSEKEAFCTTCHNSESPTFTGFNYSENWEKIKHNKPNK